MTNFFQMPEQASSKLVSLEFVHGETIPQIRNLVHKTVIMCKASPSGANVQANNLLEKCLEKIQKISNQDLTSSAQPRF